MEIKNIQRKKKTKLTKTISIRVSPDQCKYMANKNVSPTALFHEALKEIGYKK